MNDPQPTDDGFLSDSARNFRGVVHEAFADHVQLLYEINGHAVKLHHSIAVHRDSAPEALSAVLYARAVASSQAAVLLLEHGLPTQARTILRSALENVFPLAAIAKDPDVTAKLIESHDADRRTIADRIVRWKDPALRASIDKGTSEAELKALSVGSGRAMNQYELAKLADLEDWYLTLYTLFSFSAHGSVADLEKHIVVGAEGVVLEFKSEPELSGQAPVWAWVSEVLIMAMRSLLKVFALEDPQIEVLFKKLASLANDNAA